MDVVKEKTQIFLHILASGEKNERGEVKVSNRLLEKVDISKELLFDVICPKLKSEGVLLDYSEIIEPKRGSVVKVHDSTEDLESRGSLYTANIDEYLYTFKVDYKRLEKLLGGSSNKNIAHLPIEDGVKWEDVVMKFKDGITVDIFVKDNKYTYSCREMGFEDNRTLRPSMQWSLLKIFSENGGQISWGDSHADPKIKKQKQFLSSGLTNFFGIDDDPFYPYSKQEGYKLKMTIVPIGGATPHQPTEYLNLDDQ